MHTCLTIKFVKMLRLHLKREKLSVDLKDILKTLLKMQTLKIRKNLQLMKIKVMHKKKQLTMSPPIKLCKRSLL